MPSLKAISIFACLVLLLLSRRTSGQTPDPVPLGPPDRAGRPMLTPFPEEQDWDKACVTLDRTLFDNRLKCIGTTGQALLTVGVEDRLEYEFLNNENFSMGPQDTNGYVLHNLLTSADLRLGTNVRLFTAFKFDDVGAKSNGPRPGMDKDNADLHEFFLQIGRSNVAQPEGISARIGRQEIVFGTGRLVDDNYGINVRSSFEGVRGTYKREGLRIDLFAVRPVLINPGSFDDVADHTTSFWGLYSTVPLHGEHTADLYYLGLDRKSAMFQDAMGREIRHSAGVRLFDRKPGAPPQAGWEYNWEGTVQWGAIGPKSIHAWSIGTETGHTFGKPQWKTRLLLRADAASGDQTPGDHTLGTFNSLFERGAYFAPKLALAGPQNYYDLHPMVQLHPRQNVVVSLEGVWFWRESVTDGIYLPNTMLLRPATLPVARYLGTQPNMEVRWIPQEHFTIAFNVAGFFTGTVLQQPPKSGNAAFLNLGLTYRY